MWGRRKDSNQPYKKTEKKGIRGSGRKTNPASDVHLKHKDRFEEEKLVALIITPVEKNEEYLKDIKKNLEIARKGLKHEIKEGRDDSEAAKNFEEYIRGAEVIIESV